ncbi:hypothetical protein AB835_12290 [Candidatus Endobugula sertula]|uniref:Uncharacterized protein n=1 Tax=Candidatus Endobugula sertula TaxID=62101 RepID=A0A1D2QML1_9GAMM|nr:hypothetical protein AB835_12290 [Candidatus Endobugula sertula]
MWYFLEQLNSLSNILSVCVIFFVAILYLKRSLSLLSVLAFLGSLLVIASMFLRLYIPELESISLGYKKPASANPLVWILYMYGFNFGLFIFVISVFILTLKKRSEKH